MLLLGGCAAGGGRHDDGTPVAPQPGARAASSVPEPGTSAASSVPGPDASARVRSIGQGCTWQGGLTVTVVAVRRDDADAGGAGRAGYSADVRLVNRTPRGYAGGALKVKLWVGPDDRAATPDFRAGLGTGMADSVATPGNEITGSYGFQVPVAEASDRVTVGIRPSPVDQQCLLRGTAQPGATP